MYILPIAWLYVALMMAVVEATSTTGSLLGAVVTFVFYGLAPVALLLYFMGTPGRRKKARLQEQEWVAEQARDQAREQAREHGMEQASHAAPTPPIDPAALSAQPDASGHTAARAVAPIGEKL